jgi:hypothetical protein
MPEGVAASHVDELPTIWDGFGKLVRKGLGISSFGANIMDLPPDYTTRAHDETSTGQEELYVGLRGAGSVVLDDETEIPLSPEHLVRVAPEVSRRLRSGPEGVRVLCIGAAPGQVYEAPAWTEGEN